ncbi:MAG: dephospho-CoA kinase [Terriglobia bacterium]
MPSFACFGLTGGIASGKSTVASYFAALGANVIDADQIGHELLRSPGAAFDEIVQHFGRQILGLSGEIDRRRLGAIVFSNPDQRQKLNAILHPRIIQRQEARALDFHRASPQSVIIVDAALIYEAHAESRFTQIIVAWSTPEQQIERLAAKTGLSREQAALRVASQMRGDEKRARADFVVDCSLSLEETRRQAAALYPTLERLAISGAAITSS